MKLRSGKTIQNMRLSGPGLSRRPSITSRSSSGAAMTTSPRRANNEAEMMNATALKYPNCDLDHANSLLSGILNSCYGLGNAIGPLLGGLLIQKTDF